MKSFIFFTDEGYTFDPLNNEVSNLQILGDGSGDNVMEAFKCFKQNQSYILETAFKKVVALEYVGDFIRHLEL